MLLEAWDFIGQKCEHCLTSATIKKKFFCSIIFNMASTSYSAEDVLQLLEENNSEFPDSDSSGEEGDEGYPYNGPSFRADDPEFSSSDDEIDKSISDPGKLIF